MSKNSLDRKSVAFFRRVLGEDFPLLLFVFAPKFVAIIHKGTHTGGKFFPAPLPTVTPVMLAPAIYAFFYLITTPLTIAITEKQFVHKILNFILTRAVFKIGLLTFLIQ